MAVSFHQLNRNVKRCAGNAFKIMLVNALQISVKPEAD
jgi:hypothetical protein